MASNDHDESVLDETIYDHKFGFYFKTTFIFFAIAILGGIISFPVKKILDNKVSQAVSSLPPSCPLSYESTSLSYFPPPKIYFSSYF